MKDDAKDMKGRLFVIGSAVLLSLVAGAAETVRVEFDKVIGPVKPVNGVGQPPIVGWNGYRMFHYMSEAGFPYARLHDVGGVFGKGIYVDIPNLFRDFEADENDPKSYDFAFTDLLMKALVEHGVEPYFRLGVTIENCANTVKAYRILPPKDYAKWARICEHVIRHYTEGWADGYRMKITHWEIWNEPDGFEPPTENRMWRGTFAEYCKLYEVASKHLKAKFPHLKIGGYASCGFYGVTKSRAHVQNVGRYTYLVKCFHDFIDYVKAHDCPLDFFSYHCYDDPVQSEKQNRYVRDYLDAHGFQKTEMSLNEWMPFTGLFRNDSMQKVAQIAAMVAVMQNGPVDDAEIYDAKCGTGIYSPFFSSETSKPRPAYWAYYLFNELRLLRHAVKVSCDIPGVYAVAADDGFGTGALFLVNDSRSPRPVAFDWQGREVVSCRVIDETRQFDAADVPDILPPYSVWRIMVKSSAASTARPDLVAKAEAGELGYVRVAWYGADVADATKALQAALDSKARKVIVDRMPQGAWQTGPLLCGSDKEIFFEDGAEICAKAGAFMGVSDTLIKLLGAENVAIRGRGTIRMRRDDYLKPPYPRGEWRHGIHLGGARNFTLEDMAVVGTGGDGLYLCNDPKTGYPCMDVTARNCVFDRNVRQGVSVISANGLLLENCTMSNTKGLPPQAGIDFEPNKPSDVLQKCVLRNCSFVNNSGNGIEAYLLNLNARSEPVDILLDGCRCEGNRRSFVYSLGPVSSSFPFDDGSVTAVDCTFKGGREGAIYVARRKYSTGETVFRNCTVVDACTANPTNADVKVKVLGMGGAGPDSIRFENLRIRQPVERPWLQVDGEAAYVGAPTVLAGDVRIAGPNGLKKEVFDAARYRRDYPYTPAAPLPEYSEFDLKGAKVTDQKPGELLPLATVSLREGFKSAYVFYVDRPRTVRFGGKLTRVGKSRLTTIPLTIRKDGADKSLASVRIPGYDPFEFTFEAPEAGFYSIGLHTVNNAFRLTAADVPIALDVRDDSVNCIAAVGSLYLPVPAETPFSLFVSGQGMEMAGVVLRDASGGIAYSNTEISGTERICCPAEKAFRLRAVELVKPTRGVSEDSFIGVSGLPGFLFLTAERYWM